MTQSLGDSSMSLGTVWLDCEPYSVITIGLKRTLEERARVRIGLGGSGGEPSTVVLCSDDAGVVLERVRNLREEYPEVSTIVFGSRLDLPLARAALRAGARGYIHAGMKPEHITRALEVASQGELVAPRKLLEDLLASEEPVDLDALSARQREILDLVVEGMSNAEIGKRLYLSESTIKQHLRAAYKVLGVRNRTEAAKLIRGNH